MASVVLDSLYLMLSKEEPLEMKCSLGAWKEDSTVMRQN